MYATNPIIIEYIFVVSYLIPLILEDELVKTYSQIYCLIFLLILKFHPHILEVDNKFPVRH